MRLLIIYPVFSVKHGKMLFMMMKMRLLRHRLATMEKPAKMKARKTLVGEL
jgi:hypothetical protein